MNWDFPGGWTTCSHACHERMTVLYSLTSKDGDHRRVQRVLWGISPSSLTLPISGLDFQKRLYSRSVQISSATNTATAMRMFTIEVIPFQIYTFRSTVHWEQLKAGLQRSEAEKGWVADWVSRNYNAVRSLPIYVVGISLLVVLINCGVLGIAYATAEQVMNMTWGAIDGVKNTLGINETTHEKK